MFPRASCCAAPGRKTTDNIKNLPGNRLPGVGTIEKALSFRSGLSLEAPSGFEPENRGFAVPCLTTWLWRRRRCIASGYNLAPAGVGQDFHLPKHPPLKIESRFNFVWEEEDGFQFVLQVPILPLRGWGMISTFRNTLLSKMNLNSILYGRGRWI